ncbi:hypothetical protein MYE70_06710 [Marinobacter alexandrii]|uniref:hypothetical protein n=1 Tax=Marinobacter alexandrii TaxID=2570351 RepID=UPI001FFE7907|nr:hypothetical protein [Marinobacter alexandrii]MCK2148755.1 hypothetical protein [Marinobacter alexandrii]
MAEGLSITWSNSHQQLFNETMTEALKNGSLTVSASGEFSFSGDFFEQRETKGFLDRIPRAMLHEMVALWIEKRREQGLLPEE